jgi:5-(carboxyamino)imidazole ribonucleotide synthase
MGVELFDTRQELIVNELAPRVHNTGHYTMDAYTTSQFELHIKALYDQPLKLPKPSSKAFAMVNLLGGKNQEMKWSLDPQVRLHWYGKSESRPGRKMGHLNVVDSTPNSALKTALKALKGFSI